MKYTNIANLPAPLVSALTYSDYDKVGDISVTGLTLPPRIRQLELRHDDEIVVDVSELIWRMIGSIGHKIIERADTDNHLSEERLTMELHGWTISGKADLLGPNMTLSDWKFTSVWAMRDSKPEWEAQVNLYDLLYYHNGFSEIERLRIVAVLRDWSKRQAAKDKNYPQVGVVVREVPKWSREEQEAYLGRCVRVHQQAEKLPDDELPLCDEQERWRKPDVWRVKKKGGKRAMPGGLHTSIESAKAFAAYTGLRETEIEFRPGEDTRCLHYCAVKEFCSYGRTLGSAVEAD